MWYRPKHEDARKLLGVKTSLGYLIHRKDWEDFLLESARLHPEYNSEQRGAWAAHCAHTHPNRRKPREHFILTVLVGIILFLLAVGIAKAGPPETTVSNANYWHTLKLTPPNFLGQIYGGPVTARMQIRSGGAWVDVDAATGLPITCLSGCGGASSFLDNAAFTAGTTAINVTGGWFSSAPTACTDGKACAPSLTSDRKLFTQAFQGTSPWVVSASGNFGVTQQTSPWVVSLASTTITGTVGVTQSTSPWVNSCTAANCTVQLADASANLGAMVNYGSTPTAVKALSANVFVTNTPAVTLTSTTLTGTSAVNLTQAASTVLGTPQTFGTAPTGVVLGTSSDAYIAGTRARSNQTTTAAGVLDVNIVGSLGVTNSATNGTFTRLTDNTTAVGVIAGTTALKTDMSSVAGTATSTAAAGVQKVGITGNANATLDSTIGAATAPTNALATSVVFQSTVPVLTAGQAVAQQSDQTGSTYVNIEGRKQTYRAVATAFAPIASATAPSFSLTGSGTKTVRITRVTFSCSAGTGGIADVVLFRLSALSGGTSAAVTIAKNDSGNATATAAPLTWSVAATTATSAGVMEAVRYELETPTVSTSPPYIVWSFGQGAQDFVLRGTSEFMGVRFSAIATTPACEIATEWTEE